MSRSTSKTFFPLDARMAPMDATDAVLPTPPLWLAMAMIFAFIDAWSLMFRPFVKRLCKVSNNYLYSEIISYLFSDLFCRIINSDYLCNNKTI